MKHKRIPVGIIGANGYSGMELARLLLKHPYAQLEACFSRNSDWALEHVLPEPAASQVPTLNLEKLEDEVTRFKTLFLATPPEISVELTPLILKKGTQVIDLSGGFRLDQNTFESSYKLSHPAPNLLEKAQYGLVPWSQPIQEKSSDLIANPGCFATSILMMLIPLLKAGIIDPDTIVLDSKSGTSGAGLKAKENLLFNEVDGDCLPYKVGSHQHLPEIEKYVKEYTGIQIRPHFCTSLLPIRRGIISALYAHTKNRDEEAMNSIHQALEKSYQNYPLLKHGRLGRSVHHDKSLLSLKRVAGSCRTHISYTVSESKLYAFSTLDNLLKGAASQAVENWNASQGYSWETGLTESENQL